MGTFSNLNVTHKHETCLRSRAKPSLRTLLSSTACTLLATLSATTLGIALYSSGACSVEGQLHTRQTLARAWCAVVARGGTIHRSCSAGTYIHTCGGAVGVREVSNNSRRTCATKKNEKKCRETGTRIERGGTGRATTDPHTYREGGCRQGHN